MLRVYLVMTTSQRQSTEESRNKCGFHRFQGHPLSGTPYTVTVFNHSLYMNHEARTRRAL